MRCAAYCTATSFEVVELYNYLKFRFDARRFKKVIHLKINNGETDDKDGDVFFFPYGAVVFWGLNRKEELEILSELKNFEHQPAEVMGEDDFTYAYGEAANIKDDEIILPDADILTKLAYSHGLTQSVKLDVFENTIQKTVHLTRELPERMAALGKISLSGTEIRKMMGRLFIDRNSINLSQELLDTPEFFWEHADLEPIYKLISHYLDIERRVNILNHRLSVLKELFDMLNNEVNHQHSSHLEWAIIWLIVIEVILILTLHFV